MLLGELERRGAPMSLPLWSSLALVHTPELVAAVHADYVAAGADVITANTFLITVTLTLQRNDQVHQQSTPEISEHTFRQFKSKPNPHEF